MAGIWFAESNELGRLTTPVYHYSDTDYCFSTQNYDAHFYALVQLSSAYVGFVEIPLLTVHNGAHSATNLDSEFKIYIKETGQVGVEVWKVGSSKGSAYTESVIPTDRLLELAVTVHTRNGTNSVTVWFNGLSQTINSSYFRNYTSPWGSYSKVVIGRDVNVGNPKGLLLLKATLTDERIDSPNPVIVAPSDTLWSWDFENTERPFEIKVIKAGVEKLSIDWTNTDPTSIIWTEGNIPPASDTGSGGGIIIPGNDNTTRITGTITEDGEPVARRVIAVTEARLEVEGSDETVHAVLDSTYSNPVTGDYTLDTSPYEGAVMVMATDNYGERWQANTAYSMGDVIRPSHFQGYVYHCTTAGISDNTEPTWWFDTNSVQNIGTTQFKAKPFARPLAHGPIMPVIVE